MQSPYFSKWSVKSFGLEYEFVIKDGLKFSDGSFVSPQQIANIFTRTNVDGGKILPEVSKIKLKGSVIHLFLKQSSYVLPEKLSDLSFAIISNKKEYDFPIGTGAFKIKKWEDKGIILERNVHHRDTQVGNVQNIHVLLLEKSIYSIDEIRKEKIDFFPLVQVTLADFEKPIGFKRVVYPSNRVNILVANINESKIRSLFSACIDPALLLDMPYLKKSMVAYNSIIPSGVENYNSTEKKSKFNRELCIQKIKEWKQVRSLRWLNAYGDSATKEFVALFVSQLNAQIAPLHIEVINKTLQEAQDIVNSGKFDFFVCGIGSPYPLAEGILSDFVYSKEDKNKLIKFEDVPLRKLFRSYMSSKNSKRTEIIGRINDYLVESGWVIPFGRRVDTFLVPEKWKNLSMVNGMNGNFYLGRLYVEQN